MDKLNDRSSNSELYARINALALTATERDRALSALRNGALIADGILLVINGIKHLIAGATAKPSLRHLGTPRT